MAENEIQIKSGIMVNVGVSVKNSIYVKKIIFRILQHVVARMANIQQVSLTIKWWWNYRRGRNKNSYDKF